jgi:hypothetical protein
MTRKAWTTEPQKRWLEARLAAFREAQHAKTTASVFFPQTLKAFKEQWPAVDTPTEEVAGTGSIQTAAAKMNKALNNVSKQQLTYLQPAAEGHFLFSVSKIGFTIMLEAQHQETALVGF